MPIPTSAGRHLIDVVSSIDGSRQPSYIILPANYDIEGAGVPIVISLHTWSFDLEQRHEALERLVLQNGWIYLFPNFRGPNNHPAACASDLAKQDILDVLDWIIDHYSVDESRIYLTGISGGGFMTLAMVTSFPDRWTAASAWVPLSDIGAWYDFHKQDEYGAMTRACLGGDPDMDPEIAKEMRRRSPLFYMERAVEVPLEIAAGRLDGHDGEPIPIWHSLAAFNALAIAAGESTISDAEIVQLSRPNPRLDHPRESDEILDPAYGRKTYLRREAGKARITIFDGAHEGIASAALAWFESHPKR